MQLSQSEIIELYQAVVKPFGHPDPMGYMARALIRSDFDPDYVDLDGHMGFMPVNAMRARELVGAQDVVTLENNLVATLAMDRLLIDQYNGNVDLAMIDFHFGADAIPQNPNNLKQGHKDFIQEVNEERVEMVSILNPPRAEVKDVIKLLEGSDVDKRVSKDVEGFVKKLLEIK